MFSTPDLLFSSPNGFVTAFSVRPGPRCEVLIVGALPDDNFGEGPLTKDCKGGARSQHSRKAVGGRT